MSLLAGLLRKPFAETGFAFLNPGTIIGRASTPDGNSPRMYSPGPRTQELTPAAAFGSEKKNVAPLSSCASAQVRPP